MPSLTSANLKSIPFPFMKYFFFLDETGNHGLSFVDPHFPYFLLCGCLFSEEEKEKMENSMNAIKKKFFGNTDVIFHSRDIRKCEKEFQILFNPSLKKDFYEDINSMIETLDFTIIAAAIEKEQYIKKYGKTADNPYSISLSFLLERLIFCLDEKEAMGVNLFVESRGKKEDKELLEHFNKIKDIGTFYVSAIRMQSKIFHCHFRVKQKNDNGIQIADLCAYPLVRGLIEPNREYPPLNILQEKIYAKNGKAYGLKVFP